MIKYLFTLSLIVSFAGMSAMQEDTLGLNSNDRKPSKPNRNDQLIAKERLEENKIAFESMFDALDPAWVSFDQYAKHQATLKLFKNKIDEFNLRCLK